MPSSTLPFGHAWFQSLSFGVDDSDYESGDEDVEMSQYDIDGTLMEEEVAEFESLARQCFDSTAASTDCSDHLGPHPTVINYTYSSVLGDSFHFMDRAKVPVHHEYKKSFYHCLSEAMFIWDPVILAKVKSNLSKEGLSAKEIANKMYFDTDYFTQRVPRTAPKPSIMYPRVRAVYALFGNQVSSKGVPLFTKTSWVKAKNVLQEILAGHASDPPGVSFYTQQVNYKGT